MYRRLSWLTATLALSLWAWSPSVSLADDGRRGHGVTYHKQDRHYGHRGHDRRYGHRGHDRRYGHRGHNRHYGHRGHERHRQHRHVDRHRHGWDHGRRHSRHGTGKYVYDDGHCRVTVKHGRHGSTKAVRCRHGHGHAHRAPWPGAYGHGPGYGGVAFGIRPRVVAEALDHAPDDQTIVWNEPGEQTRVEVAPARIERELNGRYCREYLATATVAGETQEIYGRACRQADGAWEIVQ